MYSILFVILCQDDVKSFLIITDLTHLKNYTMTSPKIKCWVKWVTSVSNAPNGWRLYWDRGIGWQQFNYLVCCIV